ncbi:hypothetical protein ACFXBB_23375 [Streptomyces scopuliridis]|uniref:hypothetical protein n=2 Tax=Streptomyces scopuliridis TaxID=452529 RepID=UPI0036BB1D4B
MERIMQNSYRDQLTIANVLAALTVLTIVEADHDTGFRPPPGPPLRLAPRSRTRLNGTRG